MAVGGQCVFERLCRRKLSCSVPKKAEHLAGRREKNPFPPPDGHSENRRSCREPAFAC